MQRVDEEPIPVGTDEIRLFAVVRNEGLRLPYFLEYYRALGIDRFLFVDNGSTDDTRDLLLGAEDVHLFETGESYAGARYGIAWLEELLGRFGVDRWCLCVDADELLVFEDCETTRLRTLCAGLDRRREQALPALLLDMYGRGPVGERRYRAGESPLLSCPYFDFDDEQIEAWNPGSVFLWGGMRQRVFGIKDSISKYPLFRFDPAMTLHPGLHRVDAGVRVPRSNGALLHFKYLDDFPAYVEQEVARAEHWGEASEYKAYAERMRTEPLCFFHEGSARYEGSRTLAELGAFGLFEARKPKKKPIARRIRRRLKRLVRRRPPIEH